MVGKNKSEIIFEKVIRNGNILLKFLGLQLDENDSKRNILERLCLRRFFVTTYVLLILNIAGQLGWLIQNWVDTNLVEITYLLPSITYCVLGSLKSYSFLMHANLINDIITTLRKLIRNHTRKEGDERKFEMNSVKFLVTATNIVTWTAIIAVAAFGIGPLVITANIYYKTGSLKLFLPFKFYYPFNALDIRVWPLTYVHHVWSAVVASLIVWGPDYVCYALTTFIIIQFYFLKYKIIKLIPKTRNPELFVSNEAFQTEFVTIVKRHNDLIRCAEMLEIIYSKSTLFNVVSSSILICLNGFNVTAIDNPVLMAPFTAFFVTVLGQIFLLCLFGDMIMRASLEITDAVYGSLWYMTDPKIVKNLMFIAMRAGKPCKYTAYGYSDVNLKTFTKILSTAWSYFALLKTVYRKNN